jgi:dihydroflavonol-4-reductase
MRSELALITGGSGFIGAHCILHLLDAGYRVRTTVCSLAREAAVRAIVPAREGALRVPRAARDAGAKRVVPTSSFAVMGYGAKPTDKPFSAENWTDPNGGDVGAYVKSKGRRVRAGARAGLLNFHPDRATFDGRRDAGRPRLSFGVVDVREAVAGGFMTVPVVARFDSSVAPIVPELGKSKNATKAKARRVLGWTPRSNEDAIVATAGSLVPLGLLRKVRGNGAR